MIEANKGGNMHIEIQEHGIMLSDYFSGTPGVMLPLHVDNFSTKADILQQLFEEISMVWDLIESTAEQHHYPLEDLERDVDHSVAMIEDVLRCSDELDELVAPDLEYPEEDEEGPVLIFSIEFIN